MTFRKYRLPFFNWDMVQHHRQDDHVARCIWEWQVRRICYDTIFNPAFLLRFLQKLWRKIGDRNLESQALKAKTISPISCPDM